LNTTTSIVANVRETLATRKAERAQRLQLERELAAFTSPADQLELQAVLYRHSPAEGSEVRAILARNAAASSSFTYALGNRTAA
jgi:hypothetical protein